MAQEYRKKLIEHSLPLDAINAASSREKSVRHGHPSTLHLWWARRPLAACRAVIFAQLVDDPSAWPDRFPSEEDQDRERRRLHGIIANMVEWPKSAEADQRRFKLAIEVARWEIARSVAWGRGEAPPDRKDANAVLDYLQEYAPPVYDPFCGGGSIPLEAQRLGLRAYGSDLNPIPVLITKAMIEFPPKFADLPPVNPDAQNGGDLIASGWKGAQGLADDIRYYGQWMRDEAEKRIGHLYPKVKAPDGSEKTVIAWLWARTVPSPDPAQRGRHVPLASSFVISAKKGKEAIVVPVLDEQASDGWRFVVKTQGLTRDDLAQAKLGTKISQGTFRCNLSGSLITYADVDDHANAGRMSSRLMAIVAEGKTGREYLKPDAASEQAAKIDRLFLPDIEQKCRGTFASNAQGRLYGFATFADYFTSRQLKALSTFSDLVSEVREKVLESAARNLPLIRQGNSEAPLSSGGDGADAYADAVATYLGFAVDRLADRSSSLCGWDSSRDTVRNVYARQSISMSWDFAECNVFSDSSGNWNSCTNWIFKVVAAGFAGGLGVVSRRDAATANYENISPVFNTDPPYYDNITYADLSDFFYVWARRSLSRIHPDLFRRILTQKQEELIANPYRYGGKDEAERHFMDGMGRAISAMGNANADGHPIAIYYAFKQSEIAEDGVLSPGWSAFLQAVVNAGLQVDGTWPIRTELSNRMIASGTNALAASVVLVCRKREGDAATISRRDFLRELRPVMQTAIKDHQKAGIPLPDRRQAAIGPGIGVFSKYAMVRESDDSAMSVATALTLINKEVDAILSEGTEELDAATRFAIEWYEQFGYANQAGKAGDAIAQLNGFNLDLNSINASGLFRAKHGDAKLLSRDEIDLEWTPSKDPTFTLWEMAQHLARTLLDESGGIEKCGRLLAEKPTCGLDVLLIAERIYEMAMDRGDNEEAKIWNTLETSWPAIEAAADRAADEGYAPAAEQPGLI